MIQNFVINVMNIFRFKYICKIIFLLTILYSSSFRKKIKQNIFSTLIKENDSTY